MSAALAYFLVLLMGAIIVGAVQRAPVTALGAPLLSNYNIVLGLFAVYMFMPALLLLVFQDGEYIWLPSYGGYDNIALTAFVTVAALVCFLAAYWLRMRVNSKTVEISPPHRPQALATLIAWAMIAFGIALKIYALLAGGGIEESALRLSRGISANAGIEDLSSLAIVARYISGMADAAATWLLLHDFRARKVNYLNLFVFALIIVLSYFGTGKRLFLLLPVLTIGLGIHYYIRPLRVNLAPLAVIGVIFAGFVTIAFRIYVPAFAADLDIDLSLASWAGGSVMGFYFFSLEFASFEVFTLAIESSDRIITMFGGGFNAFYMANIEPVSYFVPRALWPGKPDVLVDISHAYRVFVLGGELKGGSGIAGTLTATAWTLGGPLGIAAAMVAVGYVSASMDGDRRVRGQPSPMGLIWYAFGMVAMFHVFRQGTLGSTLVIMVAQQFGMLFAFVALGLFDRAPATRRRMATAVRS